MFSPEWWHWVALGFVLVVAELAVVSFFIVWFGLGAIVVGLLVLAAPGLALATQLLLWATFSALLTALWFKFLKPRTMSSVGTSSAQAIGEVGILVAGIAADGRGQVRFQKPLLGADLWDCYADREMTAGERVRVVAVEGSFVKVEAKP